MMRRHQKNLISAAAAAAAAIGLLAGCGAPAEPSGPVTVESLYEDAVANGFEGQAAALEDHQVTREEVDTAVGDLATCLSSQGLDFSNNGANPVDGWRPMFDVFWPGLSDDDGSARMMECVNSRLDLVTKGYELTNVDVMDPSLLADVLVCASDKGVTLDEDARNLRDLLPLGAEDPNLDVVTMCIQAAGRTFPSGVSIVI